MKRTLILVFLLCLPFFTFAKSAQLRNLQFLRINKIYADSNWTRTNLVTDFVQIIEPTPWGILAGEFDSRVWMSPPPLNSIYISRNFGITWEELGLRGRGVMDIKYFEEKIYATTYYVQNNVVGLFVSSDKGNSWNRIGPSVAPTKIDRNKEAIYLGSEHCGLWVSKDEGQTWSQKMGSGCDGTKVYAIESSEDVTFVARLDKVYKTNDNGDTWSEISTLRNVGVMFFCTNENVVFAGSSGSKGLFLSTDKGITWRKVESFGDYAVGNITYFNGAYYAGRYDPINDNYTVYYTSDLGNTWVDTELSTPTFNRTLSIGGVFSKTSYLFSVVLNKGLYRYEVPNFQFPNFPFLSIPWEYKNENEIIDKITSYFDHSYPLLGYSYFSEPEEEKESTLNFLGIKDTEPRIYYSSHSGTDFGLKFGTEIIAPASGFATYHYCLSCGNTIKIDHLNGYQTTYMHLQNDGLVTKDSKIWVNKDDKIGKVGLTGRTTGPHLHFEVLKDKGGDGIFSNDFPIGRVDPFGWQSYEIEDPWKSFNWDDQLGNHIGSESLYLWNTQNTASTEVVSNDIDLGENKIIGLENKRIEFKNPLETFSAKIFSYIQPILTYPVHSTDPDNPTDPFGKFLKYVENTSFILEAFDQMGLKINNFSDPIKVTVNLDSAQLTNINLSEIKLYFWNEVSKIWEPISSFFNSEENKLTAQVNHLSWFAIFGEKIDKDPPETKILILGDQNNGWYTEFPLVNLSIIDEEKENIEDTFYSFNYGETWETYSNPFYIQKDGITNIIFKSQDINENIEEEKNFVVQVNSTGNNINKIKVRESSFSTSSEQ